MPTHEQRIKEATRRVLAAAFAPGIPARKTDALPNISRSTDNRWVMAIQNHAAQRAGLHHDLRLVDPDAGKAHSWAIPKSRMPAPGERLLAVQTHTHTPQYALHFGEKGPERIGKGYGKGTVTQVRKEPVSVLESSPDKVRFQLEDDAISEFLLRRKSKDKWLLMNTTKTGADHLETTKQLGQMQAQQDAALPGFMDRALATVKNNPWTTGGVSAALAALGLLARKRFRAPKLPKTPKVNPVPDMYTDSTRYYTYNADVALKKGDMEEALLAMRNRFSDTPLDADGTGLQLIQRLRAAHPESTKFKPYGRDPSEVGALPSEKAWEALANGIADMGHQPRVSAYNYHQAAAKRLRALGELN